MPMYCRNELIITGLRKNIISFIVNNTGENNYLDFDKAISTDLLDEKQEMLPASDIKLYVKKKDKWERISDEVINKYLNDTLNKLIKEDFVSVNYNFVTRYSSPNGWLKLISYIYPRLLFEAVICDEDDNANAFYHYNNGREIRLDEN